MAIMLAVLLAVLAAGCSGASEVPSPTLFPTAPATSPVLDPNAAFDACDAVYGDLIDALSEVDSRLSVGLNVVTYAEVVGNAKVEYDKAVEASGEETDARCLAVGVASEVAITSYIEGAREWNSCIKFPRTCKRDGGLDALVQPHWDAGGQAVSKAKELLADLKATP